jgi:hypothetical protein
MIHVAANPDASSQKKSNRKQHMNYFKSGKNNYISQILTPGLSAH